MTLSQRIVEALQSVGADIKALLTGKQDTLVAGQNIKTINVTTAKVTCLLVKSGKTTSDFFWALKIKWFWYQKAILYKTNSAINAIIANHTM